MLAFLAISAASAVDLGTSLSAGLDGHLQRGTFGARPRVDVLDLEVHLGDQLQIVPRLGRFAIGLAALEIVDLQVDVLWRFGSTDPGWQPFVAVGVGPKLTVGAGETVVGATTLGRLGYAWRRAEGATRVHVFAEPQLTLESSRLGPVFAVGARAGAAVTWRL